MVTHDTKFHIICEPSRRFSFQTVKRVETVGYASNPSVKDPEAGILQVWHQHGVTQHVPGHPE